MAALSSRQPLRVGIPSRVLLSRPTSRPLRRQREISAIKLLIFINPALTAKESTARGELSQSVKLFALVRAFADFIADFMDLRFYGASFDEAARSMSLPTLAVDSPVKNRLSSR